jgi:hypothetical protein
MYIPAVRSIPLLDRQGEFQGEAGVSTNSAYLNGSYAFSDNIAASVSGNLSYGNFTEYYDIFTYKYGPPPKGSLAAYFSDSNTKGQFSHRYGEVSVGRINMLQRSTSRKLELFGGVGKGRATDVDYLNSAERQYQADYFSFFGQGNFGLKKRIVETGISLRLAFSAFNYDVTQYDNNEVIPSNTFQAFFLEPMGFTRIGGENVKVVFRYGFNIALNNSMGDFYRYRGFDAPIGSYDWEHTFFHFSIGLSYRLSGKYPYSKNGTSIYPTDTQKSKLKNQSGKSNLIKKFY